MTKKNIVLFLIILTKFVLQYFSIDPYYELHRDEFLHLDLGRHLAWGYSSVPPVTAIISFVIGLLGNSVFWVKFFPALFGALTIVVVWKTVEELKGGLFALILASFGVLFSALVRINILYQPNSLDVLAWTLVFFTVIKYINSNENKWLYFAMLSFAIGFLNKYNIAFLLLGLAPAILLTQRKIFLNKHFYFSSILAMLIILPNLIWQYNNNFPVFHHLKTLSGSQLVNINRFDFLIEQLYFYTGAFIVIFLALLSFFIYGPFKKLRFVFFTFVFTMALFVYFRAKNYYALGLYPVLIAIGSVYLEKLLEKGWLTYLRPVFIILPVAVFVPVFSIMLPVLSPEEIYKKKEIFDKLNLTRWEDGKIHHLPQDFADMTGWKELAFIVDSALLLIDDKNSTIVHCDNYGQAGAVNYYSGQKTVLAYSMNADYINWYPVDEFEIKNVVIVKELYDTLDPNREKEIFEDVIFIGEIKNTNAREAGTKVYLLKGAKKSINQIIKEEVEEEKNTM